MQPDFLYKRGYFITDDPNLTFSFLNGWKEIKYSNYLVFLDESLNYTYSSIDGTEVFVIGTILDPFHKLIDSNEITDKLVQHFNESNDLFLDYLDTLSGRFVLFIKSHTKSFVLQDATGSRTVFYSWDNGSVYFSSHAELISEIKGFRHSEAANEFMNSSQYQNDKDRYFPRLLTPYREIKMLTPNTLLDLQTRNLERFFPRKNLPNVHITSELIDELANFFTVQIDLLKKKYKLSISLTAGLDSRLSLASAKRHINDIYFYTLTYGPNSVKDADVASEICNKLGIEHHIIKTKSEISEEFKELFLKNTSNMSSEFRGMIGEALYNNYPEDYLHIKSNGSEICRAYYKNTYSLLPAKISAQTYSKLYGIMPESEFVVHAFKEYIDKTNLTHKSVYNYDHYDLYYWEHRIGSWQGLCLYEWDIAQDSFIPFNNRYILNKMLSVPLQDRLNGTLYYEIIKKVWPEALAIPINPFDKKVKYKALQRLKRGIKIKLK